MSARSIAALGLLLTLAPLPLVAQSGFAGTWTAKLPTGVRNINGEQSIVSTNNATFVLEVRGDSIVGSLTYDGSSAPRALRGTRTGNTGVLAMNGAARVILNGEEHEIAMITTFRFTLEGDTLKGTSETAMDPAKAASAPFPGPEQDPLPVTATRTKP